MEAFDQILENISASIQLTEEEQTFFKSLLERKTFRKKSYIVTAGNVCTHETFVLKGCLKIFYLDKEGVEHIVKFAVENWWALDLESFAFQSPAFYNIQTLEDTDAFQISKSNHDLLYERIPKFEKFARLRYQNAYMLLHNRMTQNLFSTAEEKYEHFTHKYPGLEQRIAQKDLASYLGITPEFLSMLRRRRMHAVIS